MAEIFDFDEWSSLARTAPDEFEARRHRAIERIIANGADRRRLRGLQCRIDLERRRASTPMKACLRLSTLMWDSFLDCRDEMNRLTQAVGEHPHTAPAPSRPQREARIIPFVRGSRPPA